jgi:hypothetical protein
LLLASLHQADLATLTHTPPEWLAERVLDRPDEERAFLVVRVGYPAAETTVPDLTANHWTTCSSSSNEVETHDELAERRPSPGRPGRALAAGRGGRHRAVHQNQRRPQSAALRQGRRPRLSLRQDHRAGRLDQRHPERRGRRAVEVLEVCQDKPITRVRTTVSRQDGTVVLDGTVLCFTTALAAG